METTDRMKTTCWRRRGVLLLLVLTMLAMFVMLGALMLVLATRARTSARAFAEGSNAVRRDDLRSRVVLDEALMQLLRGPAVTGPVVESILTDRYGTSVTLGTVVSFVPGSTTATANITGITVATPLQFNGRVLTIKPPVTDPAPVQSYRIVNFSGGTATLANLRGAQPFVRPPILSSTCQAIINGRDFDNSAGNEPWDAPGAENRFLTEARLQGADMLVSRPAFGTPGQACQVDNDGDGVADGIWLANVLPPQSQENGGLLTFRVSYLVLDMDGRFNVNAHGMATGTGAIGPAAVDGKLVLGEAAWGRLRTTGTTIPLPQPSDPSDQQRRPTPNLGYSVDGRFGTLSGTNPYNLRLDFDGPRQGCPLLAGERGAVAVIGNLFTTGELERVMRPFDADTPALPPRLAAILGNEAQKARMRITTDSWDTTGLVGQAAVQVATVASGTGLPQHVVEGRRFDINSSPMNPTAYADFLHSLIVTLGVNDEKTRQWVANVIDYRDRDTQPSTVTISGTSVTGHETGLGNPNDERFKSVGELLWVPRGSQQDLADPSCPPDLKRSLVVDHPVILDAIMVTSPFTATVAANPWREPGRVNVNTCDKDAWEAVLGGSSVPAIPVSPAQSTSDLLTNSGLLFSGNADRPFTAGLQSDNRERADRLANIATPRSNVFTVWVTVEITDSLAPDQKTCRRLFAIVDRSIPVGCRPGVNLNARDTLRLVRYLD